MARPKNALLLLLLLLVVFVIHSLYYSSPTPTLNVVLTRHETRHNKKYNAIGHKTQHKSQHTRHNIIQGTIRNRSKMTTKYNSNHSTMTTKYITNHSTITTTATTTTTHIPIQQLFDTLKNIPLDHPYRPIFVLDSRTSFLRPNVRDFLLKTHKAAFPTRYNAVYLDTLLEFDRIWRRQLGRTYMFEGGTLFGALRHGGNTPWDDDFDLVVDIKYHASIPSVFNGTKFKVELGNPFYKVFFTHNGTTTNEHGHWPVIDLFFYKIQNNGTEMVIPPYKDVFKTKNVFPMSEISYMGHKFNAFRCAKSMYKNTLTNCCSHGLDHRRDVLKRVACIPCSELQGIFPFAKYRRINETHAQQLLSHQITDPTGNTIGWTKGFVLFMPRC